MGACMLIRRDRFVEVGGFDERYFLYWEDADLCRRLRARGYETRYVPGAQVVHVGAVSSGTRSSLATREFHRSAYRYYATHVVPTPWHPARAVCASRTHVFGPGGAAGCADDARPRQYHGFIGRRARHCDIRGCT